MAARPVAVGGLELADRGGAYGGGVGRLGAGRIDPRADRAASKMVSGGTMSVPGSVGREAGVPVRDRDRQGVLGRGQ
jgi:hypothetical protein